MNKIGFIRFKIINYMYKSEIRDSMDPENFIQKKTIFVLFLN